MHINLPWLPVKVRNISLGVLTAANEIRKHCASTGINNGSRKAGDPCLWQMDLSLWHSFAK